MATVTFDSETGQTAFISHRDGYDGSKEHVQESDFVQQSDGSYKHIFQEVTVDEELSDAPNADDQIQEALVELYGGQENVDEFMSWAFDNLPPQEIELYNKAVDDGNFGYVEEKMQTIHDLWMQALEVNEPVQDESDINADEDDVPEPETDSEVQEWFDNLDDDTIDSAVDQIFDREYGVEEARQMESLQTHYDEGTAHHDILSIGMMISTGEIDIDQGINHIIDTYGDAVAAKAYFELEEMFSTYY